MYIKNLKLNNFRNIEKITLDFNKQVNIIYGENAEGKTNLLESIYMFSFGKSFRNNKDLELLKIGEDYFFNTITYEKNGEEHEILISYDKNTNKEYIKIDGIVQKKLSSLIGKLNIVVFKPSDIEIIKEGPSTRRKFIDMIISSIDPKYIYRINRYNKLLDERNNLLKIIKFNRSVNIKKNSNINNKILNNNMNDEDYNKQLINTYDKELIELNLIIFEYRKKYIEIINNKIFDIHKSISINMENIEKSEKLTVKYISKIENKSNLVKVFDKNFENDIQKGYTEYGIHRDDIKISINSLDISKYGSQGQQKSAILSLKLAELNIIEEKIKDKPILLLDDFMSELDDNRIKNILNNIKDIQMILTTTNKVEIKNKENKFFNIQKGQIKE